MKKTILTLSLLLTIAANSFAQDKLYLHNGKVLDVVVVNTDPAITNFRYTGETAAQSISNQAIDNIVFGGSGRTQHLSDKVIVNSENDWENVVVLTNPYQVSGLTKADEISKFGYASMYSQRKAEKKAMEKLKKEAASKGCQFILITSKIGGYYGQTRTGIAYKY